MSDMSGENSLAGGEEPVLVLHPHWKPLLWPLVGIVIAAEILIPSSKPASAGHLAVTLLVLVVLFGWLVYLLLRWRTTRYELTTRHLQVRAGIIARNHRDIPLSQVTDVSFRKTPLDRLIGCGTLVVSTAGERGGLVCEVPHVERVRATLAELVKNGASSTEPT